MTEQPEGEGNSDHGVKADADAIYAAQTEILAAQSTNPPGRPQGTNHDRQHNERSARNFLGRLTVNEWLTFLVGAGSLAISYLTYQNAADTSDLKRAVDGLNNLASASTSQANAMYGQLSQMKVAAAQEERAIAATNQLAREAALSAAEARRLADAAIAANSINKQAISGVQRAFVVSRGVSVEAVHSVVHLAEGIWTAYVDLENSGNTPTENLNVTARCVTSFSAVDDPEILKSDDITDYVSQVKQPDILGPKQRKHATACMLLNIPKDGIKPQGFFWKYIFGTAVYKDMFSSVPHVTEFCYGIPVIRGFHLAVEDQQSLEAGARLCGTHNCADDECSEDSRKQAAKELGLPWPAPPEQPPPKRRHATHSR